MQPVTVTLNELNYRFFKDSQNIHHPVAPIEQKHLIRVNGLAANATKTIFLGQYFDYPVKANSLYIDSPSEDRLQVDILPGIGQPAIYSQYFDRGETPYDFPDLVLTPDLFVSLTSVSGSTFNRILFFLSPVGILLPVIDI